MTKRDKERLIELINYEIDAHYKNIECYVEYINDGNPLDIRELEKEVLLRDVKVSRLHIESLQRQIEWVEDMWKLNTRLQYMKLVSNYRSIGHLDVIPEGAFGFEIKSDPYFVGERPVNSLRTLEKHEIAHEQESIESMGLIPFAMKHGYTQKPPPKRFDNDFLKRLLDELKTYEPPTHYEWRDGSFEPLWHIGGIEWVDEDEEALHPYYPSGFASAD